MSQLPTIAAYTLGCKLNFAETSAVVKQFVDNGYKLVDFGQEADVIIINTCTVTSQADKKSRKAIHKAVKLSQNVIVIGCSAQIHAQKYAQIPGVRLVLGAKDKLRAYELFASGAQGLFWTQIETVNNFAAAYSTVGRTRSFLKVQDGCNYNCSYCIIPKARGKSRNPSISELVKQAQEIVRQGFKEIILTGVNIGDFGRSTGEKFVDLLRALDNEVPVERIRISSIEPELLTDEIIDLVARSKKFMPHFHIPLQSGSDQILRLMRRRYNTRLFEQRITAIRHYLPEAFIGIDVIVGFPGETTELFEQSKEFISSLDFSYLHLFPYSDRPGTVASKMPGKVSYEEKQRRMKQLQSLSNVRHKAFYERFLGQVRRVLFEVHKKGDRFLGFTDNYLRVSCLSDEDLSNKVADVLLERLEADGTIVGRVVKRV